MKKLFVLFTVFILALSAAGCGIKQKIENKIGEKVLESVTDNKVDVDGDKVTVKGEDGSQLTMGETEWPESELLKDIPKFDKGNIQSVTKSDAMVMIMMDEVKQEDYKSYYEEIKKGFTENVTEMTLDNVVTFAGGNKGVFVQLIYNPADSAFTITASKVEQ